jgi:hypothetical protein
VKNSYKPLPNKPDFHGPPPWRIIKYRLLEIAKYWEEVGFDYPLNYSIEKGEKTIKENI